jgi:hypothetical protein
MQLNVVQINSSLFSHFPSTKRLVAEASDIRALEFQYLYDDAIDVGIALVNAKTGNVTRWYVADTVRDKENETLGWYLCPCTESVRKNPQLEGYCITLIND